MAKGLFRSFRRSRKPPWLFAIRDRIAYQALVTSRVAAILSFIAVCLNAVVAIVAINSLNLNFRTAEQSREALKSQTALNHQLADAATRQAEASVETAKAAKQSAEISEKALRITQRAYFSVTPAKVTGFEKAGTPKATLAVRNIGATPGYSVTLKTFIGLVRYPLPDTWILSDEVSGTVVATMVTKDEALGGSIALPRSLTDEEFKRIDEADGRVIVYAFLDFNDAFGCKIQRKVCFLFNGAAARGGDPELCGGDRNDEKYIGECSHQ
jgi:hypothetical protein